MVFRYKKYLLDVANQILGKHVLKPVIPIKISIEDKEPVIYEALLDSGADFCIFDMEIADALGIEIDKSKFAPFGGINPSDPKNPPKAYFAEVKLNIGGWDVVTKVGFSADIAKYGFGILGQQGFFDCYKITFDLLREQIELKPRL